MAHAGRDLQEAKTLAHKRVKDYPNEGLCVKLGDKLYCQPCKKPLDTRKFSVLRHLGLDPKQNGNSNKGDKHKKQLRIWLGQCTNNIRFI